MFGTMRVPRERFMSSVSVEDTQGSNSVAYKVIRICRRCSSFKGVSREEPGEHSDKSAPEEDNRRSYGVAS